MNYFGYLAVFFVLNKCGSEENYEFMELNGTTAYVKYNRFHIEHRPQYVPDPFRSENFYYNKDEDYCVCPMGQHMTRPLIYFV